MNDCRWEVNWVAGKPTLTIGSKRCNVVVLGEIFNDCLEGQDDCHQRQQCGNLL